MHSFVFRMNWTDSLMRVCGLQRLDDSLLLSRQVINQPTNHHPYTLTPAQLIWSDYSMRWFDFDSMVNQQLAFSCEICDARPTHSTPACWLILRQTRNPPTQRLLLLIWIDAARLTHSTPLLALHFVDIAATSESHSWLLTLSNSLEHTTRSFPSLLRLQLSEVVFASKSSYYILRFIETYPIHTRQFHSITRAVN